MFSFFPLTPSLRFSVANFVYLIGIYELIWWCLPVLERSTRNSKTWQFLLLRFQTRWNSCSMVCIFDKLKLNKTWNRYSKCSIKNSANSSLNSSLHSKKSIFHKLDMSLNWKFSNLLKLEFDEMWARSSTIICLSWLQFLGFLLKNWQHWFDTWWRISVCNFQIRHTKRILL